jgi:hypothetical protein
MKSTPLLHYSHHYNLAKVTASLCITGAHCRQSANFSKGLVYTGLYSIYLAVVWPALLLHIRKVPISSLRQDTGCFDGGSS